MVFFGYGIACVVGIEAQLNAVIGIDNLRVVVVFFCYHSHLYEKCEGFGKILEQERSS